MACSNRQSLKPKETNEPKQLASGQPRNQPDHKALTYPLSGQFPQNGYIGLLKQISDWTWVDRRVEKVELSASGATARKITLDFEFGGEPEFSLSPAEGAAIKANSVVPLCYLRKGPLTNVDFEINGQVATLMNEDACSRHTFNTISSLINRLRLPGSQTDLLRGAWAVIYSEGYDPFDSETTVPIRTVEEHRHRLFSALALVASRKRHSPNSNPNTLTGAIEGPVTMPIWGQPSTPDGDYQYDPSPWVNTLATIIRDEIFQSPSNKASFHEKLNGLELLSCQLALLSISQLIMGVLPGCANPGEKRSYVAKLSCDAETSKYRVEENRVYTGIVDPESLSQPDRDEVCERLWFPYQFRPSSLFPVSVPVLYSTLSSCENHIELQPPPGALASSVCAITTPKVKSGDLAFVQESVGPEPPKEIANSSYVYLDVNSGDRVNGEGVPRDLEKASSKGRNFGTYRITNERVHVRNPDPANALEWIQLELTPKDRLNPIAVALVNLAVVTLCWAFSGRLQTSNQGYLSAGDGFNFLAVMSVIYGALWLSSSLHPIDQRLSRAPRAHFLFCGLTSFASVFTTMLIPMFEPPETEPSHPVLGTFLIITGTAIATFLLSNEYRSLRKLSIAVFSLVPLTNLYYAIIIFTDSTDGISTTNSPWHSNWSLLDFDLACITGWSIGIAVWALNLFCASSPKSVPGTESTIPILEKPWIIARAAPSSTETGAWDVPHIDLDYVSHFSPSRTLKEYVSALSSYLDRSP